MKFLFDLFPVLLFFVAFKFWGIYIATAVAMGATLCQVAWSWLRHRKVDTMLWVSLAIIGVFGGATLWLHDETFIKWKPTVLYWLFSAILLGSELLFRKNVIRAMMEKQLTLPAPVWRNLNLSWAAFFLVMGAANLYIAFHFATETWVNFKLFGGTGLMVVFIVAQGLLLSRYIEHEEKIMLYAIVGEDIPNSQAKRTAARPEHLKRVDALIAAGKLILGGAFPAIDSIDPGPAGMTGSLIVAEFNSLEEAKAWINADPYVTEGVFARVTVKPFRKVFPK